MANPNANYSEADSGTTYDQESPSSCDVQEQADGQVNIQQSELCSQEPNLEQNTPK